MRKGKIITISGGVGGAKLVSGLAHVLAPENLLVVTNNGDDFNYYGFRICPDTDTVIYTLSNLADPIQGWGRGDETWFFMETFSSLGGDKWFNIGDRDLALHVLRTHWLNQGLSLTEVTSRICEKLGVAIEVIPMSDQNVETIVNTSMGALPFQNYFVEQRCTPEVVSFSFEGIEDAKPNQILVTSLEQNPRAVILAPSNPFVSIDPVLALPNLKNIIKESHSPVIAISPIVGDEALKGPAAKMMKELGIPPSVVEIARHYKDFVEFLIIDEIDSRYKDEIEILGLKVLITSTVMNNQTDRNKLAQFTLNAVNEINTKNAR